MYRREKVDFFMWEQGGKRGGGIEPNAEMYSDNHKYDYDINLLQFISFHILK